MGTREYGGLFDIEWRMRGECDQLDLHGLASHIQACTSDRLCVSMGSLTGQNAVRTSLAIHSISHPYCDEFCVILLRCPQATKFLPSGVSLLKTCATRFLVLNNSRGDVAARNTRIVHGVALRSVDAHRPRRRVARPFDEAECFNVVPEGTQEACFRARYRASSMGEIMPIFRFHWSCSLFVQRSSVSIATIAECGVR